GRWPWAGGWGRAASGALHSALGWTGSWIVAATLLGVTALAASELGFHWVGRALEAGVGNPAKGLGGWGSEWRGRGAEGGPARAAAKKARAKIAAVPDPKPAKAALADNGVEAAAATATAPVQTRLALPGLPREDSRPRMPKRERPEKHAEKS